MPRIQDEYRFGKRGQLLKGDLFRAMGGPFWRGIDGQGEQVKRVLSRTGVYRFLNYITRRTRGWINAYHLMDGVYETLYVTGPTYRSSTNPGVVNRPYRISMVKPRQEK